MKVTRRQCLTAMGTAACSFALPSAVDAQQIAPKKRQNVLMIVADDMNWDSPGCFGGAAPDITPNIDRLAAEGMRFFQGYVNISLCTPARAVMLTGLYPHNNGTEGFQRIHPGTETLPAHLNEAGYLCGIVGKPLRQQDQLRWSVTYRWQGTGDENLWGRDPAKYREFAASFFKMANVSQQPFFLMANSHDPHTPYKGEGAGHPNFEYDDSSRTFQPEEVRVPGFLPDLPEVRQEMADYCGAVRRLDDTVGAVLDELDEAGLADDTIVIFLSDNGISMPYGKATCYPEGTRTPLIVRWPGHVKEGAVDREHMVSTVDLLPTILEALELPLAQAVDGSSFLPLLRGEKQDNRDAVLTQFHHVHGERPYPSRSLITKEHAYIFNAWSNGERRKKAGPLGGPTAEAMRLAAKTDPQMAERVRHLDYATVEEFYDLKDDPYCLNNLVSENAGDTNEDLERLRKEMRNWLVKYNDPILTAFDDRNSPEALEKWMEEYTARARQEIEDLIPYEKSQNFRF